MWKHLLLNLCLLLPVQAADYTKRLSPEEVEKLIRDEKNLFLLDVREAKEVAELGAIKGYINIPLSELESRLKEVPKDKVIVTVCNRAVRASTGAEILARNGYTHIAGACSMNDWKEQKKPVTGK